MTTKMGMMSLVGIVVIFLVVFVAVKVVMAIATGIGGRKGVSSDSGNQSHPRLNQCPGCGATLADASDVCPQCGLRVST